MDTSASIPPVFLKQKNIPESIDNSPTALELCLAAERISGQGTIIGAQNIRGLWRIYPSSKEARAALLVKGIVLRECSLQVSSTNPFILRDGSGEEKPSTKVWIDDIPLSVANSEIEHSLSKAGCELRSEIKTERARDADGKMTRFLTGRRFVFVTVPSSPLDRFLKVSLFMAKIYHKEQKTLTNIRPCSRCLETGHHVSECTNDIVCKACKLPGHKRGDPECGDGFEDTRPKQSRTADDTSNSSSSKHSSQRAADREQRGDSSQRHLTERPRRAKDDGQTRRRGRPLSRQATLLEMEHPRSRSGTPKRQRSKEMSSREEEQGKQARWDDDDWSESAAEEDPKTIC